MVRDQEFFRIQDNFSDTWTSDENPFTLFHTSTWAQDNNLAWDVYTTTVESIKDLRLKVLDLWVMILDLILTQCIVRIHITTRLL